MLQEAIFHDIALPELYDAQDILVDDVIFKAFVDNEDTELQEWLDEWRNRYLDAVFKLMAYTLKA